MKPTMLLLSTEPFRGGIDRLLCKALQRLLIRLAPTGDGHPILVIPGLGSDDRSTLVLRKYLDSIGYKTYSLGFKNKGVSSTTRMRLAQRLAYIYKKHGQEVSLIGWSLGGCFSRELARMSPSSVRQVIVLGSPIAGTPDWTNAKLFYRWVSGKKVDYELYQRTTNKIDVPFTSLYTVLDGVVGHKCCIDTNSQRAQNIKVLAGSHISLGYSPAVFLLLPKILKQTKESWAPLPLSARLKPIYQHFKS